MYTESMSDIVLQNSSIFRKLFLVQAWIRPRHLVQYGIAESAQKAQAILTVLQEAGLVEFYPEGFTCSKETCIWLAAILPSHDDTEKLLRRMRLDFDADRQRAVYADLAQIATNHTRSNSILRPSWYFDVTAIIHPSLSIDSKLRLTGCSQAMERLVAPNFPDLLKEIDRNAIGLIEFLRQLELSHFNQRTLEATREHILDSTANAKGVLADLAENGYVDKRPAIIRIGDKEHHLEMSFANQRAFQGCQSIWHIVDERIGYMKLIKAMRITKWFITAHRLKQPLNLFNIARAKLELLKERIPDNEAAADIGAVTGTLSNGIREFSRFVTEVNRDELKLAQGMQTVESVDALLLFRETAEDVDFIYAKPSGVPMIVDISEHDLGKCMVKVDVLLLRETFFNLLHNAFKHGTRGSVHPEIRVSYLLDHGKFSLFVEDNGPGLAQADLEQFAATFELMPPDVSPAQFGAISGLSLSMFVLRSFGARLRFENKQPTGLRISIAITPRDQQ